MPLVEHFLYFSSECLSPKSRTLRTCHSACSMAAVSEVDGQFSGTLKKYDVLLKSLLIGDSGVGKTCFLARSVGEHVNSSHIATIGKVQIMPHVI